MQNRRVVLGAAAMLLVLAGGAVRADDKTVTLARTLKAGDSYREKVTVTASVMGMDIVVTQISKITVKEINAKGQVVREQKTESAKINIGGQEQEQNDLPALTETRDKFNKLVDFKAPEGGQEFMSPEVQKTMALGSEIILPEKPVKADDTWTTEFDNPIVKDKKVTIKTTYLGTDKVDGKEYWKVKQIAEALTEKDGAKMVAEVTAWLNPANGSMLKLEGKVKDIPTQLGPVSWTMKLESLAGEKAADKDKAA